MLFHSGWLVRVMAASRNWHPCGDCGARMFVESASGRCPYCQARRRDRHDAVAELLSSADPE